MRSRLVGYFYRAGLAIEIDGDSHFVDGAQQYDRERQAFIEYSFSPFPCREGGWGVRFLLLNRPSRVVYFSTTGRELTIPPS
jgi:very-short-patch-repair endonuclease